ncbi:hypothetical protein FHS89_001811 [Rubricella aquisinus]|uniref:Uncharacterized protein n=1 Tax=Rubricella aquisinus TaxID=2028108 RepID=A0A840WMJ9_9RHOB|nr:hypothetical protein [Rubricella aquisinus]MBB5515791.1 hypothetical protein [Rubricella aquisinus]
MNGMHERLPVFLANLDHLSAPGQFDAICNEVIESCGTFTQPNGEHSHLWELHLHDVSAVGGTEEEAIGNWKRLAKRVLGHAAQAGAA